MSVNPQAPIRFIHIPKCGGSSVYKTIEHALELVGLMSLRMRGDPAANSSISKPGISFYHGHCWADETGIPEADSARTFTILRDPIDRVISLANHAFNGKQCSLPAEFKKQAFTMDDLLSTRHSCISNLMTKMLGADFVKPSVSQAFDNLLSLHFFGLLERIDIFPYDFSHAFGIQIDPVMLDNQAKDPKIEVLTRHIEKIAELNIMDISLYHLAKKEYFRRHA